MTTPQQKVQEALTQGWAMYAEAKSAEDKGQDARNAYNLIKGSLESPAYTEAGEAKVARKTVELTGVHEARVASAQDKLDVAIAVFEKAKDASQVQLEKEVDSITEEWLKDLDSRKKKLGIELLGVQAASKDADDKVRALRDSMERFFAQTEQSLGVNIRGVVIP